MFREFFVRFLTGGRLHTARLGGIAFLLLYGALSVAPRAQERSPSAPTPNTADRDTTISPVTPSDTTVVDSAAADTSRPRKEGLTDTVRYEADVIRYNLVNRSVRLLGNAKASYEDVTLYADTIIYRMDENLFFSVGSPRLVEGNDVTVGDTLTYNIKSRRGSIRYATTHMTDDYFTGRSIVKSKENHLYIEDGDYTTCADLDHPHYSFYGNRIKIIPSDKAISSPVVLNIGEAPVAVFPYYIMPLERGRRSGFLTPGWGGHPTSGGYLDNLGYYWAPNDYMDFSLAGKVKEFRDVVLTGQARYRKRYWLDGALTLDYHLGTDFRADLQEWALSYRHNQNLLPDGSLTLRGNGNLSSSTENRKSFYEEYSDNPNEIIRQSLRAGMALEKRLPRINSSVRLSWNRSHNLQTDHIVEDIPQVSFGLPNRPLIPVRSDGDALAREENEEKWYNRIYYSYNFLGKVRRDVYENDSLPSFVRPGMTNSLSLSAPQKIFKYFTITPTFSARLSSFYGYMDTTVQGYDTTYERARDTVSFLHPDSTYDREDYERPVYDTIPPDDPDDPDSDTMFVRIWKALEPDSTPYYDTSFSSFGHDATWQTGVSLSTKLYGLFPIKAFGLNGIRHELTPSLSYTFVPEHEQDKRFFDIGIPYDQGHDRSQRIGIRIDNLFQGKTQARKDESGKKSRGNTFTILNVGVGTSYDFEAEERKWSDIQLDASTSVKFARISFGSQFWMYDGGDEGGELTWPTLRSYSVRVTPNNFAIGGQIWDGNRVRLDSLRLQGPADLDRGDHLQQWRLSISPSYTFSASRETPDDVFTPRKNYSLTASAGLSFSRNWAVSWSSTFDFVSNSFERHALNFYCDLECWEMVFNWTPRGVQPGYYYFRVNIKKLPDIKWEERE